MGLKLVKAHAYGNDFVYLEAASLDRPDAPALAQALCARHTGIGADGLILFQRTDAGATMRLFNADGSFSEVSGNGVRGLAAVCCWTQFTAGRPVPASLVIQTDAGAKAIDVLESAPPRFVCRAAMGHPMDVRRRAIDVGGERVDAVVLRVGNPQCVVLEHELDEARYRRLGPLLAGHPDFPEGTNVEFAVAERADRVRILIWERGVGPTLASGTGACASAVAAMEYGGAARAVDVESAGGTQRVEWRADGLFLTGWAEVLWEGRWTR
ncbi:MAG: diaminopimelate epimerase [Acidobacteria bacterium]|nr:diaminopimelate epimerase [Acidobacteriota bacterium]